MIFQVLAWAQTDKIKPSQSLDKNISQIPSIGPVHQRTCDESKLEWKFKLDYFSRDHDRKQAYLNFIYQNKTLRVEANELNMPTQMITLTGELQYMFIGDNRVPRQLAKHHLRQRVLETPILLDDLRSILRLISGCESELNAPMEFFKDSMIVYSNIKPLDEADAWRQYQYRWKQWREWRFKSWLRTSIWNKRFPQIIELTGYGEEWGSAELVELKINGRKVRLPQINLN